MFFGAFGFPTPLGEAGNGVGPEAEAEAEATSWTDDEVAMKESSFSSTFFVLALL